MLYLIFGLLTTAVNYIVFYFCYDLGGITSTVANAIAFIAAVIFAYLANKIFVFESKSWEPAVLIPEALQFLGTRGFSFAVEEAGLLISDNLLGLDRYTLFTYGSFTLDGVLATKLFLAVFVVIVNYVFCKWIFKKK
ncbi:MAG: GtrA family protein [Clostridia bacterium]|nr:GtrA family protein [Clostridia bacterium]